MFSLLQAGNFCKLEKKVFGGIHVVLQFSVWKLFASAINIIIGIGISLASITL